MEYSYHRIAAYKKYYGRHKLFLTLNKKTKRVTVIGGVFFKCKDPEVQKAWYDRHIGMLMDKYRISFERRQASDPGKNAY